MSVLLQAYPWSQGRSSVDISEYCGQLFGFSIAYSGYIALGQFHMSIETNFLKTCFVSSFVAIFYTTTKRG